MKGVIFSFDNVLCETNYLQKRALFSSLKEFGYYWSNEMEKEYERRIDSSCSRLDYLISSGQIQKEDVSLIESMSAMFASDTISECKFSDRIFEQLESFKTHGLKISIASNCRRNTIINFLKSTRLNEIVDFVTSADASSKKPNPAVYLQTLQKMKLDPQQVTVYEGSRLGVSAARAANIENVRETNNRNLESSLKGFERIYLK